MQYQPIEGLRLNYNMLSNSFKNNHNGNPYLVYAFFLIDEPSSSDFQIADAGWYQVQSSGKTYEPIRVHAPRKRGMPGKFVATGTLVHAANIRIFASREDAEAYLHGFSNNQKIAAQKSHDYFEQKLKYLDALVLP